MERRIFGIENEYAAMGGPDELPLGVGVDELTRALFEPVVRSPRVNNVFLENGARLYLDVGSHPEYATAESDSIHEAVVCDKAGERIVDALRVRLKAELIRERQQTGLSKANPAGVVYVFKNNRDSDGNQFGAHENYLVDRTLGGNDDLSLDVADLIPFFVSRQLLCGAGDVISGERGSRYALSQRAEAMEATFSSSSTNTRPIISTRDEPHADETRFRRLHVIVGDANMSEWSAFLKLGSAHLVLQMMEDGESFEALALANPVRALRIIATDLTGARRVALKHPRLRPDGSWQRDISGLELQEEYLCRAEKHFANAQGENRATLDMWRFVVDSYRLGDRDYRAAAEAHVACAAAAGRTPLPAWESVLNDLPVTAANAGAPGADAIAHRLRRTVDWAIKYSLIRAHMARNRVPLSNPRVALINLMYHNIDRENRQSWYYRLEKMGLVERVCTDEEITTRMTVPPQTTRARLRGAFITAVHRLRLTEFTVDWESITMGEGERMRLTKLPDPLQSRHPALEKLIAELDALPAPATTRPYLFSSLGNGDGPPIGGVVSAAGSRSFPGM